ncbi:MAG: putative WD repeat domain phosphoinositide-interacting protein 2 [Streblomastix strix]|uniref:Putative WD repeat domain phosphoinositide-interacting protein 2 n=1 Tax=Streblomastix strix TaxID=222440 RepID=A0A5J4X810_9EUKA|nr:MAG: putative WD repeat domain phosphoinositide-interacting protein 2 [Streblomastix strix]
MQVREKDKSITFMSFNQTNTCLIVGTKAGFKLFRTQPFEHCTQGFLDYPIHICEMFFSTSLLAVVCASDDPKEENFSKKVLYLYNTKIDHVICLLRFAEDIHSVILNQQSLIVVLRTSIVIYTLEKIEPICTLDIYFNQTSITPEIPAPGSPSFRPNIAALCPNKSLLAYPCDLTRGNVCLAWFGGDSGGPDKDLTSSDGSSVGLGGIGSQSGPVQSGQGPQQSSQQGASSGSGDSQFGNYHILEAHDHPVCALAFRKDGKWLATASARGTCIRVWDTTTKQKVMEFKRSHIGKPALIRSLCFSEDGQLLVVSSSSTTIHVFAVTGEHKSDTSFACIYLKEVGITENYNISSFGQNQNIIQVAFADGMYYHFQLPDPTSSSKKCVKVEMYNLLKATI